MLRSCELMIKRVLGRKMVFEINIAKDKSIGK